MTTPPSRSHPARTAIMLVLTAAFLLLLAALFDVRAALSELANVHPAYALAVCSAVAGSRAFRGLKWNVLLRAGGVRISNLAAVRLTFIGQFFAVWTPASVGSDFYRTFALRRDQDVPVVVSSLLLERYTGLLSVTLMAAVTLPWTVAAWVSVRPELAVLAGVAMVLPVVSLPFLLAGRANKPNEVAPRDGALATIRGLIVDVRAALARFGAQRRVLAGFLVLTVIEVLSYVLISFLSLRALGSPVSFSYLACAMPLVYLVLRIPISIQDLGVQEGVLVLALGPAGVTPPVAIAVSLLQRAAQWASANIPGALLWAFSSHRSEAGTRRLS